MDHSYAVLGLGRFGKTVATALFEAGKDVMIVDKDEEIISECSSSATYAIVADLSDEREIKQIGLENVDVVLIGMGQDIASSILCTILAKEAGVKRVIAKVGSERMGDILLRVGCDRVIFPEKETGRRTAHSLIGTGFMDYYSISDKTCMIKMTPKKEWIGKTVRQLDLRNTYHLNIAAVAKGEDFDHLVDPEMVMTPKTVLLVICAKKEISRFR